MVLQQKKNVYRNLWRVFEWVTRVTLAGTGQIFVTHKGMMEFILFQLGIFSGLAFLLLPLS